MQDGCRDLIALVARQHLSKPAAGGTDFANVDIAAGVDGQIVRGIKIDRCGSIVIAESCEQIAASVKETQSAATSLVSRRAVPRKHPCAKANFDNVANPISIKRHFTGSSKIRPLIHVFTFGRKSLHPAILAIGNVQQVIWSMANAVRYMELSRPIASLSP